MKNKKIITAFLAITFSILSILTPLACVSAKMDQATTYQESSRKESHRKMSAPGTAVPNTGYVENVYFDTTLTTEEVLTIIENANLNFVTNPLETSTNIYAGFSTEDLSKIFLINQSEGVTTNYTFYLYDFAEQTFVIFWSSYSFNHVITGEHIIEGWNLSNGYIQLDSNVINYYQDLNLNIGQQNEALSSLFSITPFVENEDVSLIEAIGTGIANSAELFGAVLASALTAIASVFFANNELSLFDTFIVIAIGATVVSFAIKLILKLIQKIKV